MALRRKFKLCRQPLCSEERVAEFRAKFGRPGASGRKRLNAGTAQDGTVVGLVKKARFHGDLKLCNSYEDEASIRKHIDHMKAEMRHKTPNLCLIKEKMGRTRTYRQQYCHSNTTADVLTEFPALRTNAFLIADVLSLYGVDVSKLADRLLLIHEQVLAETKKRRQYERYMAQFSHDMETVDEAARSKAKTKVTMRLLPSIFNEDETLIFGEQSDDFPLLPQLQLRADGWWLTVDGQKLLSSPVKSPAIAIEAWYSVFWCLSIEYPPRLKNTCLFVEKALLGVHGKAPAIVTKWANRLLKK